MKNKLGILLLPFVLLACNFLFPTQELPAQPTVSTVQYGGADNPVTIFETETIGFTVVRIHPGDVAVETMIAAEAQKAISAGLMPVVEFDAVWCPPCQAIEEALESRNQLMVAAYQGVYIIKLDVDEWGWGVGKFKVEAIPIYFKVDQSGKPTGEVIDGGAWGDNIPENMAPPMNNFFHGE